jgi:hypothetical protein
LVAADGILPEAATLGAESVGRSEITFVVSDRPLTRSEVRAVAARGDPTVRWIGHAPLFVK